MDIIYEMMAKTEKQKQKQLLDSKHQNQNKRNSIMETRQLMQQIIEYVTMAHGTDIDRGTKLPEIYIIEAIRNIRNLDKRNYRTPMRWIKKLVEREFISKCGFYMCEILDTGKDWSQLGVTETNEKEPEVLLDKQQTKDEKHNEEEVVTNK